MKWEFKHNWKCFEKMMNRVMFCSCLNKRLLVFVQNISLWIKNTSIEKFKHYSTATLMLVTSGCLWCYVDNNYFVLVPDTYAKSTGCWWQRRTKPLPIPQGCRQQILSPTSVTNIDIAIQQRPHWCWWQMLVKVYLGDNFEDNRFF